MALWPRFLPRVPGSLVAILLSTAAVQLFQLPVETIVPLLSGVHAQPLIALERSGVLLKIGEDNALPDIHAAVKRAREIAGAPR